LYCYKIFSKVLLKITTPYTIGLTATPKRADKMEKIFYWFLGPMLLLKETPKNNNIIVNIYYYTDPKMKAILYHNKLLLTKMISKLSLLEERNKLICKILKDILTEDKERNVLILSDQINHLVNLRDMFDNERTMISTTLMIGKMKEHEREIAKTKQVIFGTYKLVSVGFDLDKLDTIILASPRSNIKQSIGRITRKPNPLKPPMIIDIIDTVTGFKEQGIKRVKYYKMLDYNINYQTNEINDLLNF